LKKTLLSRSQISLSTANEHVLQAIVELLLPSQYRVPELCLVANNTKRKGDGRFGFLDIFVLAEEMKKSYISIELKYISLVGLVRNNNGKQIKAFGSNELKELDEILEKEDEETLLKRKYIYYAKENNEWRQTTIGEVLNSGIKQLENYIKIIAKGQATYSTGICDERIKVINLESKLIGFIVLVVGFRRVIWRSVDEIKSKHKYIKIK
jgi:hypothetical protein